MRLEHEIEILEQEQERLNSQRKRLSAFIEGQDPAEEYFSIVKFLTATKPRDRRGKSFEEKLSRGAYLEKNLVKLTEEHRQKHTGCMSSKTEVESKLADVNMRLYSLSRKQLSGNGNSI